jgi:hypothetical protein
VNTEQGSNAKCIAVSLVLVVRNGESFAMTSRAPYFPII